LLIASFHKSRLIFEAMWLGRVACAEHRRGRRVLGHDRQPAEHDAALERLAMEHRAQPSPDSVVGELVDIERSQVMHNQDFADTYEGSEIYLPELAKWRGYISSCAFRNCTIRGPALILPKGATRFGPPARIDERGKVKPKSPASLMCGSVASVNR
jgi:hypothetical protein